LSPSSSSGPDQNLVTEASIHKIKQGIIEVDKKGMYRPNYLNDSSDNFTERFRRVSIFTESDSVGQECKV